MATDPNLSVAASIARRLAKQHPTSMLPCPGCAAEVKGENLDKHLRKVHGDESTSASGPMTFGGVDQRMFGVAAALLLLFFAAIFPILYVLEPYGRLGAGVVLIGLVLASIPMVLASLQKFPASVTVDGDALELRWFLGLMTSRVEFPVALRTGVLYETRHSHMSGRTGMDEGFGPKFDVDVGGYLELTGKNGKAVRLGAKRGPRLGKYWELEDHGKGGRRKWWDAHLEPAALVQLQYLLADRGELRVRT